MEFYPSEAEAKGYSIATKAVMSIDKISATGWRPAYSFEDALKRTYLILKNG